MLFYGCNFRMFIRFYREACCFMAITMECQWDFYNEICCFNGIGNGQIMRILAIAEVILEAITPGFYLPCLSGYGAVFLCIRGAFEIPCIAIDIPSGYLI